MAVALPLRCIDDVAADEFVVEAGIGGGGNDRRGDDPREIRRERGVRRHRRMSGGALGDRGGRMCRKMPRLRVCGVIVLMLAGVLVVVLADLAMAAEADVDPVG